MAPMLLTIDSGLRLCELPCILSNIAHAVKEPKECLCIRAIDQAKLWRLSWTTVKSYLAPRETLHILKGNQMNVCAPTSLTNSKFLN
jgi:hypothetical protein